MNRIYPGKDYGYIIDYYGVLNPLTEALEFGRYLKIALSSETFHNNTPEEEIEQYKRDMKMFMNLRRSVQTRYSDNVDFKKYEGQIQKLMDRHISVEEIIPVTGLVDILDRQRFKEEVEQQKSDAAKADMIASRTSRHITERMELDESFYKKFSELINETIVGFLLGRVGEVG